MVEEDKVKGGWNFYRIPTNHHRKMRAATTMDEEIIHGVRAEKEGKKGLICGPIAATTLEKVVDIPITALRFEEGPLINSIKRLTEKI